MLCFNWVRKYSVVTLLLSVFCIEVAAQENDSALISNLLKDIADQQVKTDGEFYAGMFPSFRESAGAPHNYQPDNNIFFTAISAFSLRNMLPNLNAHDKSIALQIIEKIKTVYPNYRNRYGAPYYGFWPTYSTILPHTYYFKYLKSIFSQGEDADDTVIILLTDNDSSKNNQILREQLIARSNKSSPGRGIISTRSPYKDIPAYSTYLGNKTAVDFDFAVHCNILYFILDKGFPLVKQDSATINLLAQMIKKREYMSNPTFISPYYVHSSILLYHIARLMGTFTIPELEPYRKQLIQDMQLELQRPNRNIMDKIILSTSLLRLGATAPELNINSIANFEKSNQNQFIFFNARAAYSYPSFIKNILLHWSYINYYFYCPAYNKVLWLEYLTMKKARQH